MNVGGVHRRSSEAKRGGKKKSTPQLLHDCSQVERVLSEKGGGGT